MPLDSAFLWLENRNIDIQQGQLAISIAGQEVIDAKNALLPNINFGASRNYNFGLAFDQVSGQLVTGNRWSNSANANLNGNITIFQGFQLRNRIRLSKLNFARSEWEIIGIQRILKIELLSRFFQALTNQSIHESSRKQLEFSKNQLELQQTQFNVGTKTLVDVSLAESQVATDELNSVISKLNYVQGLDDVKQLLNFSYSDSINLIYDRMEIPEIIYNRNNIEKVLRFDPFILKASTEVEAANLILSTGRNKYYPTISFNSGYGTNYSSERRDFLTGRYMPFSKQIDQNRNFYLGLSLSIPIFDGYKIKSDISRAKIDALSRKRNLEKVTLDQEKIYLVAMQEYERAKSEHTTMQIKYLSLKQVLAAMKERHDVGVTTSIDFAKAVLDHNIAEFELISARYNLMYRGEVLKVLFEPVIEFK